MFRSTRTAIDVLRSCCSPTRFSMPIARVGRSSRVVEDPVESIVTAMATIQPSGTITHLAVDPPGWKLMPTSPAEPALTDPEAREFLRQADPVLARIIDARPDFRPRAWTRELPALDAFSTLIFQVLGQQLSVRATRTILGRLQQSFGGRLPTPAEMVVADPAAVRSSGMSARKAATLRAVAQRFVDGSLSDASLSGMSDDE